MERPDAREEVRHDGDALGGRGNSAAQLEGIVEDDVAVESLGELAWIDRARGLHDHLGFTGEVVQRTLHQHPATVHDDESVGHALGLGELVGRDEQGTSALLARRR